MDLTADDIIYSREEARFVQIFPYEIWEIVLSNKCIKDRHIVETLSKTSLFFRRLLSKHDMLSKYLSHNAWQVILSQFHKNYKTDPSYNQVMSPTNAEQLRFCNECWKPIHQKWFSGILNLRLVCRSWCNAVDTFYESSNNLETDTRGQEDKMWLQTIIAQWESKFWKHFGQTHKNSERFPLIGREVVFILKPGIQQTKVQEFLEKWGNQVWYCTIGISVEFKRKIECYYKLRQALSQLPNLKGLYVQFGHFANCVPPPGRHIVWGRVGTSSYEPTRYLHDIPYSGNGLEEEMKANPLPILEHLEMLQITDLPDFVKEVLRNEYSAKVKFREVNNNNVMWTVCVWHLALSSKGDTNFQRSLNENFETRERWDYEAYRHLINPNSFWMHLLH